MGADRHFNTNAVKSSTMLNQQQHPIDCFTHSINPKQSSLNSNEINISPLTRYPILDDDLFDDLEEPLVPWQYGDPVFQQGIPRLAFLKSTLIYRPTTGVFYWKSRPLIHFKTKAQWRRWQTQYAGEIAGDKTKTRASITMHGRSFLKCRLAWLMYYHQWPMGLIRYRDRNPEKVAIHNLILDSGH
jgi:hypothetical protein